MKKLVFAVAALGLLSLTACKEDHTCKCTSTSINQDYPLGKQNKGDAKSSCETLNTQWKNIAGGKCELK